MNIHLGWVHVCAALAAVASLLGGPRPAAAQDPVTCDAKCAAVVFGDSAKALSAPERQAIAAVLPYKLAADGSGLVDTVCEQPAQMQAATTDLNGDGKLEVFLLGGNGCLGGAAGSSVSLFVKDKAGKYAPHLGFPAGGYYVLETKHLGYPDLKFGGPGFCSGVWRWNGTTYDFLRNEEEEPGGCEGVGQ